MALVEGAALSILSGKTNGIALQQQQTKSQRFRETIIDGALAVSHLRTLIEQLGDLGMHVKTVRHADGPVGDLTQLFTVQASVRFIFGLETAAMIGRPVFR